MPPGSKRAGPSLPIDRPKPGESGDFSGKINDSKHRCNRESADPANQESCAIPGDHAAIIGMGSQLAKTNDYIQYRDAIR